MPERHDDDLLTKQELMQALSVSARTIERWITAGIGPPSIMLPGGRRRWRWGSVRGWLLEQEEQRDRPER